MGQRDTDRVVDLGRAGEGGVETLAVQFSARSRSRFPPAPASENGRPAKLPLALPPTCTVKAGATFVKELLGVVLGEDGSTNPASAP
jgi:hypothetical protein